MASALETAVGFSQKRIAEQILTDCPAIDHCHESFQKAFITAARLTTEWEAMIRLLIRHRPRITQNSGLMEEVALRAAQTHPGNVGTLLQNDMLAAVPEEMQRSMLLVAAVGSKNEDAALALSKSEVNLPDSLMVLEAASKGMARLVELFLNRGFDVNYQDRAGRSALIVAAQSGHANVVTICLRLRC